MEIVIPQAIQAVAALLRRLHQFHFLRFVFGDENHLARSGTFASFAGHGAQDVIFGAVVDVLRRIQPETIQMELVDPVTGIRDAELADRAGIVAVEVDGRAPVGGFLAEELRCEFAEVVAVGAEMIVDHVQDHAQAERMRAIDEAAKVVGRSIDMRGREPLDAVITPAESARKFGHRHHFQNGDAGFGQMRQLGLSAAPRCLASVNVPMCIS